MNLPDDILIETTCDGGIVGTCDQLQMKRAVRVKICDDSTPPTPISVNVTRCGGTTESLQATNAPNSTVIITGSTQPIPVCIVDNRKIAVTQKCDKATGNTILIRSVFLDDTNVWQTPTYYDLVTGLAWTGNPATDLEDCADSDIESDAIPGCDNGVAVTKWVLKKNGVPTGTVYFTNDVTNAIVTPTSWAEGSCIPDVTIVYEDVCITNGGVPLVGRYYEAISQNVTGTGISLGYVKWDAGLGYVTYIPAVGDVVASGCCTCIDTTRVVKVDTDCAGATEDVVVNGDTTEVVLKGSIQPIEVRIKEDCTVTPPIVNTLKSGGVSIASGSYAALLGSDGTTWNNPGGLRSVTIRARKSNISDAVPGSGANQVMIQTTDNKVVLLTGESVTFSVEDGNIQDLISVDTLVDSAALVIYNRL